VSLENSNKPQTNMSFKRETSVDKQGLNDLSTVESLFGKKPQRFYTKFVKSLSKDKSRTPSYFLKESTNISPKTFTTSQKQVYTEFKNRILHASSGEQTFFCVLAGAGNGKSYLLEAVAQLLSKLNLKYETIAYSGIAASNCKGITCHSFLQLNYLQKGGYEFLVTQPITKSFREKVSNLEYLLIDECGFINPQMLYYINDRLCKAKRSQQPFGGIKAVYLCGDFSQIGSVCGPQLYEDTENLTGISKKGCDLFKLFSIFTLKEKVRQANDVKFQNVLDNVRYRKVTSEDVDCLKSRLVSNLKDEEIEEFSDATSIFPYNCQVNDWNHKEILSLGEVVHKLRPKVNKKYPPVAEELLLCKKAKVILRKNLSVRYNLCNGTKGVVHYIVYDKKPNTTFPSYVLVHFPAYTGPICVKSNGLSLVPVVPLAEVYYNQHYNLSYPITTLPLKLGFSCTVHGVQGTTLSKTIIYLGNRDIFFNPTYVALSRVSCLKDILLLDSDLQFSRLTREISYHYEEFKKKLEKLGIKE